MVSFSEVISSHLTLTVKLIAIVLYYSLCSLGLAASKKFDICGMPKADSSRLPKVYPYVLFYIVLHRRLHRSRVEFKYKYGDG